MAVPANTRETYPALGPGRADPPGGIREDLSDIIYNISPEETPFMSAIGKGSCDNTYFEWQTDELADPVKNVVPEGDEATVLAVDEPIRTGNYTQISTKTIRSSGTAEAVDFAGRNSTLAYQMAKKAKECKLDMESMLLSNQIRVAGSSGTPRETGGVGAWIHTNLVNATSGAATAHEYGGVAPTPGADKVVEEADLRTLIADCWDSGAKPDVLMVNGPLKMKISQWSQSVSDLRTAANNQSPAFVVAAVDVYVSDFGNIRIVPNRLMPANTAYLLDYDFWDVTYLRPFFTQNLAITGDSTAKQLLVEYGLRSKNEAANGAIHGWNPEL